MIRNHMKEINIHAQLYVTAPFHWNRTQNHELVNGPIKRAKFINEERFPTRPESPIASEAG